MPSRGKRNPRQVGDRDRVMREVGQAVTRHAARRDDNEPVTEPVGRGRLLEIGDFFEIEGQGIFRVTGYSESTCQVFADGPDGQPYAIADSLMAQKPGVLRNRTMPKHFEMGDRIALRQELKPLVFGEADGGEIPEPEWHHVSFNREPGSEIKVYVNGEPYHDFEVDDAGGGALRVNLRKPDGEHEEFFAVGKVIISR